MYFLILIRTNLSGLILNSVNLNDEKPALNTLGGYCMKKHRKYFSADIII